MDPQNETPAPAEQPQLQHSLPAQPPQYISHNSTPTRGKSKLPVILTTLLILALLGGGGYLGYQYKFTSDKLAVTQKELTDSQARVQDANKKLEASTAAQDFIAKYNDASLSRNLCNGTSVGMFDIHVNDKFVVFRYLCANKSGPIQIGAFAIHGNGSTDFTYGSTPGAPNKLPSYIYDTEPAFFGPVYGTTRF